MEFCDLCGEARGMTASIPVAQSVALKQKLACIEPQTWQWCVWEAADNVASRE